MDTEGDSWMIDNSMQYNILAKLDKIEHQLHKMEKQIKKPFQKELLERMTKDCFKLQNIIQKRGL